MGKPFRRGGYAGPDLRALPVPAWGAQMPEHPAGENRTIPTRPRRPREGLLANREWTRAYQGRKRDGT